MLLGKASASSLAPSIALAALSNSREGGPNNGPLAVDLLRASLGEDGAKGGRHHLVACLDNMGL